MGVVGASQGANLGSIRNSHWPTLQVVVDFTNPGSSFTTTWTDITKYVRRLGDGDLFSSERGRNYERAQTDAGTCTFVLDNSDGTFDPNNTASPFYPNVKPIRKFQIRATWAGVTYNLFYGFVEDWPRVWQKSGFWGEITATARGVFSSLSNIDLLAFPVSSMITDNVFALYRLNDDSGSVGASNSSSYQQPFLGISYDSNITPASKYQFGGPSGAPISSTVTYHGLAGDPTPSLQLTPDPNTSTNPNGQSGYHLVSANQTTIGPGLFLPKDTWSWECWIQPSVSPSYNQYLLAQSGLGTSTDQPTIYINTSGNVVATSCGVTCTSSQTLGNGGWSHVVVTRTSTTLNVYVDGVKTSASGSSANYIEGSSAYQYIGTGIGTVPGNLFKGHLTANLKNLGWYQSVLSDARVLDHMNAGTGYWGDSTGQRFARLIGSYSLADNDSGNSVVGAGDIEGKNLVQAIQNVNDTEVGTLVELTNGMVYFYERDRRGGSTSVATFGETGFPYEDGLSFLQDPKEIYTKVIVSRAYGITITATDTSSALDYFPRTLSIDSQDSTDIASIYLAQYQLYRYKVARNRIPKLIIKPSHNPSLWSQALGRDIGDRITVTKQGHSEPALVDDFSTTPFGGSPRVTALSGTWSWDSTNLQLLQTDTTSAAHFAVQSSYTRTAGIDVKADFTLTSDPAGLNYMGLFLQGVDGSVVSGYRIAWQGTALNVYAYTSGTPGSPLLSLTGLPTLAVGSTHKMRVIVDTSGNGNVMIDGVSVGVWKDTTYPNLRPGYFCFGDSIAVKNVYAQAYGANTITEDFYIDKIMHEVKVGEWTTSFMLSSATLYDTWVLGDPVFGVLGKTTVVGY